MTDLTKTLKCSFCGKSEHQVDRLIAGPNVYMCNECVVVCSDLIEVEVQRENVKRTKPMLKPHEIHEALNEHVIGQDLAKKVLSVAVYNHYKRLESKNPKALNDDTVINKSNILMLGPTGCGKTLLAQTLAKILDVPFAIADATTLTEAGYVGDDVETILQKLLAACDYDVEKAQRGIIYVDEIDKITRKGEHVSITRDVSGEGVQQALLKLIEGTVSSVQPQGGRKHPGAANIQLDTTGILFIVGGAFAGLDRIIQRRTETSSMGFTNSVTSLNDKQNVGELLQQVQPHDLVSYGLIPEFIGRLPIITTLNELSNDDIVRVLTEPKNAITKQYRKLMAMEDVDIFFETEALLAVADLCIKRNLGARGLRSVLESVLLNVMYELPRISADTVTITADVINGTAEPTITYKGAAA